MYLSTPIDIHWPAAGLFNPRSLTSCDHELEAVSVVCRRSTYARRRLLLILLVGEDNIGIWAELHTEQIARL